MGHTGKVWQESKRNPQQRMPAACGKQFRKGQRKPHRENRANRQNYSSLPPVAAQTAREKATQTAQEKPREQAELHVASANGSANRTRKGGEQAELHLTSASGSANRTRKGGSEQTELQFTSASGSANRTEKTARIGRITFHFRQWQRKPHEKRR